LAACAALAAALGAVRFLDLGSIPDGVTAYAGVTESVSQPLPLPLAGTQATSAGAEVGSSPELAVVEPLPTVDADAEASILRTETSEKETGAQQVEVAAQRHAAPPAPHLLTEESAQPVPAGEMLASLPQPYAAASEPMPEARWVEHLIAKGESLAAIFGHYGLDARLLHNIVNSSQEAKSLAQIRPGQRLRLQFDENNELTRLELHRNRVESIRVAIADDEITAQEVSKDVETRVGSTAGVLESSLFVDGQKAGLSDGQIMELAGIFGWDIDFALEIRAGDQFRVLFEEQYLDGEKLRNGPILAAEFTNRGTTYRAVRYEDGNGEVGYYDADGQSKRRAFIRTPIKFARVSSRYNPKRWHPILKKWRSHKGVDYAAPTGTPVKATGDGRVVFRGTKNGYGKTVILEHAGKYTTLYAHLSGFSKRAQTGNRVKQGQVIGYVGKTGLASGPHLHYEFRVQGQHRDPLRVKLPKSLSLPKSEIAQFRKATAPLLAQLEGVPAETMVASAQTGPSNP